ncbi:hypothetical protein ODZ83_10595 [Acaricomes phytoseiuli]|uniref:DoxX family protein n=1 Tax=Acaricomes phytoseiuli TaxID=291968 RepID=UPI000371A0E3|nr:hypothetical protein [Acaricomes phytoseiuli]MCW1250616.1 hypothetical protein [Acaricomes phytoseiuli]
MSRPWSAWALAGLLTVSAVQHRRNPRFYYPVIPRELTPGDQPWSTVLPSRREWVELSGTVEFALAAGLVIPGTRTFAARATSVMFAGFTVAHVSHLRDVLRRQPGARPLRPNEKAFAMLRLPLQVPLVIWAWRAGR